MAMGRHEVSPKSPKNLVCERQWRRSVLYIHVLWFTFSRITCHYQTNRAHLIVLSVLLTARFPSCALLLNQALLPADGIVCWQIQTSMAKQAKTGTEININHISVDAAIREHPHRRPQNSSIPRPRAHPIQHTITLFPAFTHAMSSELFYQMLLVCVCVSFK